MRAAASPYSWRSKMGRQPEPKVWSNCPLERESTFARLPLSGVAQPPSHMLAITTAIAGAGASRKNWFIHSGETRLVVAFVDACDAWRTRPISRYFWTAIYLGLVTGGCQSRCQ